MNLVRLKHISSATKSTTTINLQTLETHLNQCQNLNHFNQILSQTILTGFIGDTFAASRLIKSSTEFHFVHVDYSFRVFTLVENPNGFIWNTIMRAYVQRKSPQKALSLYKSMLEKDFCPDNYTYPVLVHSCALRLCQFGGKQIHCHVFKTGFDCDVYVGNTLINMYAVCRNMVDARKLFDESPRLDSVSWNSILSGYVQTERVEEAKDIYDRMPAKNTIASNSMIAMFGNAGRVEEARGIFDEMPHRDMVSWSAMASCFERNGMYEEALTFFVRTNRNGVELDEVAVITALSACAHLSKVHTGEIIHCLATKIGVKSYVNLRNALIHLYSSFGRLTAAERLFHGARDPNQITWNSMLSGYLRFGSVDRARAFFDAMPERDAVSWSAMMSGYSQNGRSAETLELFREMHRLGVRPDEAGMVAVVSACSRLSALETGRWAHDYVKRNGLEMNPVLGSAVIDMYMKCGSAEEALGVFRAMGEKNGVSAWNAVILGLATNGLAEASLGVFSEMRARGPDPNEVTFVAVLGACRHVGMVDEGRRIFASMARDHSIEPNLKHYNCLVDLLGRAGLVEEAEEVIAGMPMEPDAATWGALLGGCRKHGAHEAGERVGRRLVELRPEHDGFHVILSGIRASRGDWGGAAAAREDMRRSGAAKEPGRSAIEAGSAVREFLAGDGRSFAGHRERGGDASFGIIGTAAPEPMRVVKNLRMCND